MGVESGLTLDKPSAMEYRPEGEESANEQCYRRKRAGQISDRKLEYKNCP